MIPSWRITNAVGQPPIRPFLPKCSSDALWMLKLAVDRHCSVGLGVTMGCVQVRETKAAGVRGSKLSPRLRHGERLPARGAAHPQVCCALRIPQRGALVV
jgi:hypothetical protein